MVDSSHEKTRIVERGRWRGTKNQIEGTTTCDEFLIKLQSNGAEIHGIYVLDHDSHEAVVSYFYYFSTFARLAVQTHSMNSRKNKKI